MLGIHSEAGLDRKFMEFIKNTKYLSEPFSKARKICIGEQDAEYCLFYV